MPLQMFLARQQFEVLRSIVELVAVLVMDLVGTEWERVLVTVLAKLPKRDASVN